MTAQETKVVNAVKTTLANTMAAGATACVVASATGIPAVPFYICIDPTDPLKREYMLIDDSKVSTTLTMSSTGKRNLSGSAGAVEHASGAEVRISPPMAQLFDDVHDRVDALDSDIDAVAADVAAIDAASLASLLTTQGDTVYASSANTPARLPKGTPGQVKRMNPGGTAPEWSASVPSARARRTTGNITLNSTTWANADTGMDLTLSNVAEGDIIEVSLSALVETAATDAYFDAASIVSAAPVNYVSGGGGVADTGVAGWYAPTGMIISVGGSVQYVVQAGDLATGTLTLRLRYRTGSGTNRTLYATTAIPLQWAVKNLGH